MKKKIIFSAGGTGGHILPAINLMSADQVARVILHNAKKGNGEVIVGGKGKILVFLSKVSSSLTDFLLSKVFCK